MFRVDITDNITGEGLELTDLTNNGLIELKAKLEKLLEEVNDKIKMEV